MRHGPSTRGQDESKVESILSDLFGIFVASPADDVHTGRQGAGARMPFRVVVEWEICRVVANRRPELIVTDIHPSIHWPLRHL